MLRCLQLPTVRMSNVAVTYVTYSSYADRTQSRAIGKKNRIENVAFFRSPKEPQRRHRVAKRGKRKCKRAHCDSDSLKIRIFSLKHFEQPAQLLTEINIMIQSFLIDSSTRKETV